MARENANYVCFLAAVDVRANALLTDDLQGSGRNCQSSENADNRRSTGRRRSNFSLCLGQRTYRGQTVPLRHLFILKILTAA